MSFTDMYREEVLNLRNPYAVNKLSDFLIPLGFHYDPDDVDYTMVLYSSGNNIVGTGSYQGQVLKYLVVAPEHRGTAEKQLIQQATLLLLW